MDKNVLLDLTNEATRKYGDLPTDFAEKMVKRIRRKFAVQVETQQILQFALHCKEIYEFGKSIFKECLNAPKGKYADPRDVDGENFLRSLATEFPKDDFDILKKISGWIIYYEYLH